MNTIKNNLTPFILILLFITIPVYSESELETLRVQTNRYTWTSIEPANEQQDLLAVIVDTKFQKEIKTVGQALTTLLQASGYRLGDNRPQHDSQYYLYTLPLPEAHRHLGPMELLTALDLLGGPAFNPHIDPVKRQVSFQLSEAFADQLTPEDILHAKTHWQQKNITVECTKEQNTTVSDVINYGPIKEGETLSTIAASLGIHDVDPKQLMMAIFDHNPHAFEFNNINSLKTGSQLIIPSRNTLQIDSPSEAEARFRTHFNQWLHLNNPKESADAAGNDHPTFNHH